MPFQNTLKITPMLDKKKLFIIYIRCNIVNETLIVLYVERGNGVREGCPDERRGRKCADRPVSAFVFSAAGLGSNEEIGTPKKAPNAKTLLAA